MAAINRQFEIMKILLEQGADPDLGDDFVNIYQTAREKQMNSLGILNFWNFFQIFWLINF